VIKGETEKAHEKLPCSIVTSTKKEGSEFLESMLVMETEQEERKSTQEPAEEAPMADDGFWMMTAKRLMHHGEGTTDNTAELTKAVAELLKHLDSLLNRDDLQTLDVLLPKADAPKGTASRLLMDYMSINRDSDQTMYLAEPENSEDLADDDDAKAEAEECVKSKKLLDMLLLDTIQLISIVTNPFDPNDPVDIRKMLGKGEFKGGGVRNFVTELCGPDSVKIVEVVSGFLNGSGVTKRTISDLVSILCMHNEGAKPLVKESDRDKAKAFILGVFALCNENADIREFRHCALALGNFDDKIIEIITNFAQGSYDGKNQEKSTNDHGEGFLAKIFSQFDADRSGTIDFYEFQEMLRYINVNISQEKAIQIFTRVDSDGSKALTYDEFERGFALLASEIALAALQSLGITDTQIYAAVGSGFLILIFLFSFIFLGMAAFTENSTFGSVVNSGFLLGGGAGVATSDEDTVNPDDPKIMDYLKEKVEEALEQLNPE
jgi:hypothetical protein